MTTAFVIYAILMLAGGIFGFRKAGSKASLIIGVISGILLFIGVGLLGQSYAASSGAITSTSFFLSGVFALRLFKTRKFMPWGMLLALSLAAAFLAAQLFIARG